ncbi:N-acetylmuramoyl-L-alanine amidase [Irregularibacter muris]|uniref:N-acetylmuramoyl-L-alanine amidase n=1 Tax=Irregularibacter muris TaxID=1796619 RepID=A0AAE3L308_9FIRM|nr:N-acetylmuramoyl-L-alanine amidase [Irregularibacter muris]MCR1897423.1 N-acetylmuramoyl-L-alanine amidase [Irregularibacter muris]
MRRKIVKPGRFILFILLVALIISSCSSKVLTMISSGGHNKILYKVVIDPGHGGKDPGATGASGLYEKDFTLSLSKEIARLLEEEPQIEVHMTRKDDTFLSAEERYRPNFANDLKADLYISIHGNTFTDPNLSGTQSFYYHDNSQAFAQLMHQYVMNASGFKDQGVQKGDYFVLRDTNMPAALLEIGYLTNPQEEQKMLRKDFQRSVAASICEGIKEYLEIE